MQVSGSVASGLEPVRDVFASIVAAQPGTGAAAAIWRGGDWVVDLWGGWADRAGTMPWQRDSIVQPYSVSKPFVATCALVCVDRGLLDLDAAVQRYWPEFQTPTSVRELLSHQSGIVALDMPVPTEVFYDWDELCRLLAAQGPAWRPGTAHGESALFYGHLVGELVRRTDGRLPGEFLAAEIAAPLGLDFKFGLGRPDLARTIELTGLDELQRQQLAQRPSDSLYWRAIANPPGARDPQVVNSSQWRSAQIPAINGHGTARAMAGLYVALQQGQILSEALLDQARTAQTVGVDRVFGEPNAWGLGFGVDADGYGMGGLGGSYAGYSLAGDYAIAFATGSMGSHERIDRIDNAFRFLIGLDPIA